MVIGPAVPALYKISMPFHFEDGIEFSIHIEFNLPRSFHALTTSDLGVAKSRRLRFSMRNRIPAAASLSQSKTLTNEA